MASLSNLKQILLPFSLERQVLVAATMAKSSCHWIDRSGSCWDGNQSPLIHSPSKNAPNPLAPEASVYSLRSSASIHELSMKMDLPFHAGRNCCHHKMSARALLDMSTWWCSRGTEVDREINRRVNSLPAGMILAANASFPTSDSNCRFVAFLRSCHLSSSRSIYGV